ncbi:MAG: C1 family peptidase [Bacteroidales bacterium]|nr:C1 family peptidase [Bacteroidales bacterium]
MKISKIMLLLLSASVIAGFASCSDDDDGNEQNNKQEPQKEEPKKEEPNPTPDPVTPVSDTYSTGYFVDDASNIVKDFLPVSYGAGFEGVMPTEIDLTQYMPPIGDQDVYGTCVAWSLAYNYRSYLRAKAGKLTKSQLADPTYQFSPKDLFYAIDKSKKGENGDYCNGTNFQPAFEVMQDRGVATLATVPYTDMNKCENKPEAAWTREANEYKISEWFNIDKNRINKNGADELKAYLCTGKPIALGARLYKSFKNYKGGVLSSQTDGYWGLHAMLICGYDDNKQAFKVVNSWGTKWGDKGYLWVDYDYMVDEFVSKDSKGNYNFYVAYSKDREVIIDDDDDIVDDDDLVEEYDLAVSKVSFKDYYADGDPDSDDPTWRTIEFNVYNAGKTVVPSSKKWQVVALIYNAYNADDRQYLQLVRYTDEFGSQGERCKKWTNGMGYGNPETVTSIKSEGYAWCNVDLQSGQGAAEALSGKKNGRFAWPVRMEIDKQLLNGDYYIQIIADYGNVLNERCRDNNVVHISADDGGPLHIVNGVIKNVSTKKLGIKVANGTVTNSNAISGSKPPFITFD